jgi:hypothetical protein
MKEDEMAGHVTCTGEERNACRVLIGKHEGGKPLVRSGRRLEGNIKIRLKPGERVWIGFIWPRVGISDGLL